MKKISLEDVVTLKSGGIRMTAVKINENKSIAVHWTENGRIQMNAYDERCLMIAPKIQRITFIKTYTYKGKKKK
jgi:uncharacterized protein YodC (DUF2158 family)